MSYFKQMHKDLIFYFLILTVFAFPISVSLKSICLTISACLIFISPDFKRFSIDLLKEPWLKAILFIFFLIVLGLFIGDADWAHKITYFNKYSKILYIPLLAYAFQDKRSRNFAIYAFILAMLFTLLVTMFENLYLFKLNDPNRIEGPFQNRIDTGLFVAFAAYLSALKAVENIGYLRLSYWIGCSIFCMYILFFNSSRTGYLSFSALFLVFLVQHVSYRKLILSLPIASLLCCLLILQSPSIKYNVGLAFDNVKQFKSGDKNTSIGFRLQFAEYSYKLFSKKPLMGYGTAGFAYQFIQDNPIPAWGPRLGDPHNQYWGFLVDYGLIGLLSLFYFFFTLYQSTRQLKEQALMVFGLLVAFLAANFCDSFLLLANGGYFFVFFAAIGLGESIAQPVLSNKEIPSMTLETC